MSAVGDPGHGEIGKSDRAQSQVLRELRPRGRCPHRSGAGEHEQRAHDDVERAHVAAAFGKIKTVVFALEVGSEAHLARALVELSGVTGAREMRNALSRAV